MFTKQSIVIYDNGLEKFTRLQNGSWWTHRFDALVEESPDMTADLEHRYQKYLNEEATFTEYRDTVIRTRNDLTTHQNHLETMRISMRPTWWGVVGFSAITLGLLVGCWYTGRSLMDHLIPLVFMTGVSVAFTYLYQSEVREIHKKEEEAESIADRLRDLEASEWAYRPTRPLTVDNQDLRDLLQKATP